MPRLLPARTMRIMITGLVAGSVLMAASVAAAQSAGQVCGAAAVIPLTGSEPPAKIVIDPPLAEPLANALAASPRVGHIHVRVDDASWVWADASGNPIILQGLVPGPHKVLIDLVDANHHTLDQGTVTFVVPEKTAAEKHQ